MARPDLRKYIVFDETPLFIEPFVKFTRTTIGCLCGGLPNPSLDYIKRQYHKFVEKDTKSNNPLPEPKTKIARIKRDVVLGLLPNYLPQWIDSDAPMEGITFTPADLGQPVVNSHVIILEGAGDVLFQCSNVFRLLDCNSSKYNSHVHFHELDFNAKRSSVSQQDMEIIITNLYALIRNNQNCARRILVVVWKDINNHNNTAFVDWVTEQLKQTDLNPDSYAVTYFGSAKSKGTNEFCGFADIALIGSWKLPGTETAKFNKHFNCNISNKAHIFWYFVQQILRIGIRHHNPTINFGVYYTSDYDSYFISQLEQYFRDSRIPLVFGNNLNAVDWLEVRFQTYRINATQTDNIRLLCQNYPELENIIKTQNPGNVKIPLDDLYNLIPKIVKKRREYDSLKKNLAKLGVNLEIT